MTIKKNFDSGDFKHKEERAKGLKNKGVKNREEQRIKQALRHGDLSVVEDEFDDDLDYDYDEGDW